MPKKTKNNYEEIYSLRSYSKEDGSENTKVHRSLTGFFGFKNPFAFITSYIKSDKGHKSECAKSSFLLISRDSPKMTQIERKSSKSSLSGWRGGVCINIIITFVIMLMNTTFFLWARMKYGASAGEGVLYQGTCSTTSRLSLIAHTVINILSTLLLGASNYTMQVLGSPTRAEVNRAHKNGTWLDIGCQSYRNLKYISGGRSTLYIFLGLLSLPLHLMYNSVVYTSLGNTEYQLTVASENYVSGKPQNVIDLAPASTGDNSPWPFPFDQARARALQRRAAFGGLKTLDVKDCIRAYNVVYQSTYGDFIAISHDENPIEPVGMAINPSSSSPNSWLCGNFSNTGRPSCADNIQHLSKHWVLDHQVIDHCLVEVLNFQECELKFNLWLLAMVIMANLGKLWCMVTTLMVYDIPTFVTTGDAIASFIHIPEKKTKGACVFGKDDFEHMQMWENPFSIPSVWRKQRKRWHNASSARHWIVTISICLAILVAASSLLATAAIGNLKTQYGIDSKFLSLGFLASLGLGSTLITSSWKTSFDNAFCNTLLANLPQLGLSIGYLMINRLFTIMFAAHEWRSFAKGHNTLRVTRPEGSQRSNHFLQIQYQYGLVFLVFSMLLHYFTSESFFLATVNTYTTTGSLDPGYSFSKVGYSAIAIFITIILGITVLLATLAVGMIRSHTEIPMVGTCSAAISAACHCLPSEQMGLEYKAIMWGEVSVDDAGIGHCAFSAGEVKPPREGGRYL